jgi:hypothetical protein
MKKIIENLRNEIKTLAAKQVLNKTGTRRQIQELTWMPGSEVTVAAIRSARDEQGHRKFGKKALKQYRRPETGPQRCHLAQYLAGTAESDIIRFNLLAYGLLRGRSYNQIESYTLTKPGAWTMHQRVKQLFGTEPCPYTQADLQGWLDGTRLSLREVA